VFVSVILSRSYRWEYNSHSNFPGVVSLHRQDPLKLLTAWSFYICICAEIYKLPVVCCACGIARHINIYLNIIVVLFNKEIYLYILHVNIKNKKRSLRPGSDKKV